MSGIFKDSKENRISNAIFFAITKLHFTYLLPDFNNIDEVYTNNLNIWFINNSENKETKDGKGVEISNGILLNPDNVIFSKTKDGFELTEMDFINSELKLLEFLDLDKLNLIEQKQLKFYNDFLNKKKLQINWNLSDFLKHYKETKRFGFTILKAYKKEDFENLKERLDIYFVRFSFILKNLPSEDRTELVSDFKDQLLQLKNKQTITKFSLKIDEYLDLIDKEMKNQNTINKYKNSFNPTALRNVLNFKNEDETINEYHYLKLFNDFKNDLNEQLDKYNFDRDYLPHLKNFNIGIEKLLIEIIKHYRNVLNFESSKMQDFKAYNYRDSLNYNQSLSFLKSYSNILINLKLQDKDINQLKNIQDYCINTLNQSLESLKTNFEIDVFNSPLNTDLSKIKKVLKKAINKSDLMQYNKETIIIPQQIETVKPDEVTKYNWFIIGLKFANGEMKALLKTHNNNATKIATELGNKDGFRPYISESIGVKKHTSEKSIYSDYDKMKTIIEYCKAEKTEIQSEFLMYFNKLEQEQ